MRHTAIVAVAVVAVATALTLASTAGGTAKSRPKPVTVKSGYFAGSNGDLPLGAIVASNRRSVLVEFKAVMKCPAGVDVNVFIDTAIDRRSSISRRGSFRARGPDEDLRGPFNTVMRVSGRFISPRRAKGNFRLSDPATGCDSGEIPFTLRYRD